MLKRLGVRDFSLVRDLGLDLTPGLTVITGESGAGKTLIFDAINFALGGRSHRSLLAEGARECLVELEIELSAAEAKRLAAPWQAGMNQLMRRYTAKGRNVARLNGTAVSMAELAAGAAVLFEITGQFASSTLYESSGHLELLDAFGDQKLGTARVAYDEAYGSWLHKQSQLNELKRGAAAREQEIDFLSFQVQELERAGIAPGERAEVEGRLKLAQNAQALIAAAADAAVLLSGSDEADGAYDITAQADTRITEMADLLAGVDVELIDPEDLSQRLGRTLEELREIGGACRDLAESIQHDPKEAVRLGERFDELLRIERKYEISADQVAELLSDKRQRLELLTGVSHDPEELAREVAQLAEQVAQHGAALSKARQAAAVRLEKTALGYFTQLEFPQVVMQVELVPLDTPGPHGLEQVEFLISLNPGEPARPLAQVASGGEASRLLLGLKAALAERQRIAVMLLDEIEAGLGGAAAERVAKVMAGLAEGRQLLAISHLPVVAAQGATHIAVRKRVADGRTLVSADILDTAGREDELSRMLGDASAEEERALARRLLKDS